MQKVNSFVPDRATDLVLTSTELYVPTRSRSVCATKPFEAIQNFVGKGSTFGTLLSSYSHTGALFKHLFLWERYMMHGRFCLIVRMS